MLGLSIMLCIACATFAIITPQARAIPSNWTYLGYADSYARGNDPTYVGWLNDVVANTGGQSYQYIKVVITCPVYTGPIQNGYFQSCSHKLSGFTLNGQSGSIIYSDGFYQGDTSQVFIRDGFTPSMTNTVILNFGSRISGNVNCQYYPETGYPHNQDVQMRWTVYGSNEPILSLKYSGWEDNGNIAFDVSGTSKSAGWFTTIDSTVPDGTYTITAPATIGDMTLQYYYVNGNWHNTTPVTVTLSNQDATVEAVYG